MNTQVSCFLILVLVFGGIRIPLNTIRLKFVSVVPTLCTRIGRVALLVYHLSQSYVVTMYTTRDELELHLWVTFHRLG